MGEGVRAAGAGVEMRGGVQMAGVFRGGRVRAVGEVVIAAAAATTAVVGHGGPAELTAIVGGGFEEHLVDVF